MDLKVLFIKLKDWCYNNALGYNNRFNSLNLLVQGAFSRYWLLTPIPLNSSYDDMQYLLIVCKPVNIYVLYDAQVLRQNVTGLQWIASESWIAATAFQTPHLMPYLAGMLGIAIRRGEIPGLREYLLQIRPDQHHNNSYGNNIVRVQPSFWWQIAGIIQCVCFN